MAKPPHEIRDPIPNEPDAGGRVRSAVFGREFRLTRKRHRIGLWEYTLHVRP
jgi:hypothetical protein